MEEKDIVLLDNYFNGLLNEREQQEVRNRVATDPAFAQEFELRQQMEDWPLREVRRQALAEQLRTIGADQFSSAETAPMTAAVNRRRWLLAAASLALLAVAVWFMSRPEPSLYRQYAQYAPLALTQRGAAESDAAAAERAFNTGRYAEALDALDRLLATPPENPTARLYRGLCLLELQRPADARAALEPLARGQSALRADAVWYTALSYLPDNDTDACRSALQTLAPGDEHYEQAQQLLKKLPPTH